MSTINKIKSPIKLEMSLFEEKFKESLKTNVSLLDKIMHYIIKRKGKQMRPMFVFLCAKSFDKITDSTYNAASMIELLHTATLVHDDVIDESNFRRGFFSINALWKNKIAVLVGDFLLSRGLLLAVEKEEFQLLKIVSRAVKEMSEGELLQIEKTRRLNITEEIYFEIIRKKTATLIAACCESGASSINTTTDNIESMRLFGENAGIAFQIKDDLFDYTQSPIIGKPTGLDIREKKMTLPLIYTLNKVDKKTNKFIINTIKNDSKNQIKITKIINIVKDEGGLIYAEEKMKTYYKKGKEILNKLEQNDAVKSLHLLMDYVVNRKK
ncbi:MAG: polyprenyl synthetase family protein [Flavobacteriales bacterium]|jgi:octaprenyl-diphosphate synthase|nr:polyprenyl synthetase family protein [Flavobacteriales bacterium]|tara:strand:+ start:27519 stop:28493 length:975 start_codon:yes stop_codon:yes gene_type:complete